VCQLGNTSAPLPMPRTARPSRFRKDKACRQAHGERIAANSSPAGKEETSILNRIHLFTLGNKLYLYCIV
jgi:hypothetical protein